MKIGSTFYWRQYSSMLAICKQEHDDGNNGFRRTYICEIFEEAMLHYKGYISIFVAYHKLRISQEKDLKGTFLQFPTPPSSPITSEGHENYGRFPKFRLQRFSPFSFSESSDTFYIEDECSRRLKPFWRSVLTHRSVGKVDVCDRSNQSLSSWINQHGLFGINL